MFFKSIFENRKWVWFIKGSEFNVLNISLKQQVVTEIKITR